MAADLDPDACPCCSPPWLFNSSFVQPFLVVGFTFASPNAIAIRAYALDGSFIGTLHQRSTTGFTSVGVSDIAVDRSTGNIYFVTVNDAPNKLWALDAAGNVLWSQAFTSGHEPEAVAVDNAGHVYSGYRTVRKFNATTGVETTTGGWPHTPSGGFFGVKGICCDQSGNVYVCGGQSAPYRMNAFALDSSASVLWFDTYAGADSPSVQRSFSSVAVNAAGNALVLTMPHPGGGTYDTEFILGASDGSITDSHNGPFPGLFKSAFDKNGNYYTAGQNTLRKNGSQIYGFGGVSRQFTVGGLAYDNQSTIGYWSGSYLSGTGDKYKLAAITDAGVRNWGIDSSLGLRGIDSSRGRIGAFGL